MSTPAPDLHAQLRRLLPATLTSGQQVAVVAVLLIVVQLVFRAWAVYGGWFFVDDFKLLSMTRRPLSIDLLTTTHDDKLMPGGMLVAWVVSHTGAFPWPVAATSLLVLQAGASLSAWIMLRTLFGDRWGILPPLALFLFLPLTLSPHLWWAAGLNLVPVQIATCLAVAAHVRFLTSGRARWAVATVAAIGLGLFFYQKGLLVVPVLAVLTLWAFVGGGPVRRIVDAVRRWWVTWLLQAALVGGYLAYHLTQVSSPVSTDTDVDYPGLVGTVLGSTFLTGVVGGPWRWDDTVHPPLVDPPASLLALAGVLVAGTVVVAVLRRRGAWFPFVVLTGYVVVDGLLLAAGRGSTAGVLAAGELRYVSDAAPVVALALGLAFLPLAAEVPGGSRPRDPSASGAPLPRPLLAGVGLVVAAGCVVSSLQYVSRWHGDLASRTFVTHVTDAERRTGDLDLLDAEVPPDVLLGGIYPWTLPSRFFNGSDHVHAHRSGTDLRVLDAGGFPRVPAVLDGASSPEPEPGTCGDLYSTDPADASNARPDGLRIPLSGRVTALTTWVSISYLATADGEVTLTAGETPRRVEVVRGPHTFWLRNDADDLREVVLTDLDDGVTLCVASVRVGTLTATGAS